MSKIPAIGAALSWDPAGGSTWKAIGQIFDISVPELSRETGDTTTHDSEDMWREFGKLLKDGGEMTFSIFYDPGESTHGYTAGLLSDFAEDSTIATFQLVFPDTLSTTWSFSGIVTAFPITLPIDDFMKADITIKVAGKPTLA